RSSTDSWSAGYRGCGTADSDLQTRRRIDRVAKMESQKCIAVSSNVAVQDRGSPLISYDEAQPSASVNVSYRNAAADIVPSLGFKAELACNVDIGSVATSYKQ